jgi:hypothetical protein
LFHKPSTARRAVRPFRQREVRERPSHPEARASGRTLAGLAAIAPCQKTDSTWPPSHQSSHHHRSDKSFRDYPRQPVFSCWPAQIRKLWSGARDLNPGASRFLTDTAKAQASRGPRRSGSALCIGRQRAVRLLHEVLHRLLGWLRERDQTELRFGRGTGFLRSPIVGPEKHNRRPRSHQLSVGS